MTSSSGSVLLAVLLLLPLVGALAVVLLRGDAGTAKLAALAFSVAELVVALVSLFSFDKAGARLQQHFSLD